jgi:hypothetical protein
VKRHILPVLAAVCVVASLATAYAAQSRPESWEGYYAGTTRTAGGSGVTAEVDVFAAYEGQALYIDFKIDGRDGVILGAVASGQDLTTKQFRFSFTDNTGQRGSGTLSRSGDGVVLRLTRADKMPASAPSDSLYKEYTLERKEAKGQTNRHPWSMGRNRPGPPRPSDRPPGPNR